MLVKLWGPNKFWILLDSIVFDLDGNLIKSFLLRQLNNSILPVEKKQASAMHTEFPDAVSSISPR